MQSRSIHRLAGLSQTDKVAPASRRLVEQQRCISQLCWKTGTMQHPLDTLLRRS